MKISTELQEKCDSLKKKFIAQESKIPNKVYFERQLPYIERYYNAFFTREEIIEEIKKLKNEGCTIVHIRPIYSEWLGLEAIDVNTLKIAKDFYKGQDFGTSEGNKALTFCIVGAELSDKTLLFYFSFLDEDHISIMFDVREWLNGNPVNRYNGIIEYNGNFNSTKEVREWILNNRDTVDGYIIRGYNAWDGNTIYRWQELNNGKIIWRKEKA
jgi:hypothetical protein